jgi:predicted nucleotidyltransferase
MAITPDAKPTVERLIRCAMDDAEVLAVILFGSAARGEETPASDIDICLVLRPGKYASGALTRKVLDYAAEFPVDVHIYQRLPIYIRARVLKDGEVLFSKDDGTLYDLAFETVRQFEDFRPIYNLYLEEVARVRS